MVSAKQKVDMLTGANVRCLTAKYLPPTNTMGSRIKIYDRHFEVSVTIPFNYTFNSASGGAVAYLIERGFDICGVNSSASKDEYIIIMNDWDSSKQLK